MTQRKRQTLEERVEQRIRGAWKRDGIKVSIAPYFKSLPLLHVRAELDRLARQVRNAIDEYEDHFGGYLTKKTILALIREAKR